MVVPYLRDVGAVNKRDAIYVSLARGEWGHLEDVVHLSSWLMQEVKQQGA